MGSSQLMLTFLVAERLMDITLTWLWGSTNFNRNIGDRLIIIIKQRIKLIAQFRKQIKTFLVNGFLVSAWTYTLKATHTILTIDCIVALFKVSWNLLLWFFFLINLYLHSGMVENRSWLFFSFDILRLNPARPTECSGTFSQVQKNRIKYQPLSTVENPLNLFLKKQNKIKGGKHARCSNIINKICPTSWGNVRTLNIYVLNK